MRRLERITILLGVVAFFAMGATYTLNVSTPAGSDDPREADDRMREIKNAFIERLDRDHSWNTSATSVYDGDDVGKHDKITFIEAADIGTGASGQPVLGAETVSGAPELTWLTEGDATLNITDAGTLNIVEADLLGTVTNNTYFTAIDNAGTGTVDLIKADANDVAVVPDNSQTATNAAPTSTTGITNKKYVDDEIATATEGQAATANDSESNAMLKAHAYLTQTAGFVNASLSNNTSAIVAFVGATDDPAGAGTLITRSQDEEGGGAASVAIFVPNGSYFEITAGTATPLIMWTALVTGGAAPIDQD